MWMKKVEAKERLWWVEDMATQNVSEMAEATQIARPSADRKGGGMGRGCEEPKGLLVARRWNGEIARLGWLA